MSPENFQPFDLQRIFLGDLPWSFTLEILFRTTILYLYTIGLVRLLSRRAIGQLSLIEYLLIVGLGSAVGDPMFYFDVPLLHGFVVIATLVGINYGLNVLLARYQQVEEFIEGRPVLLIEHGRILPKKLTRYSLAPEELFEYLRLKGVEQLGEVRQAYLEQGGQLSVFTYPPGHAQAGLRINPPWELIELEYFEQGQRLTEPTWLGCCACGYVSQLPAGVLGACPNCHGTSWCNAVTSPQESEL